MGPLADLQRDQLLIDLGNEGSVIAKGRGPFPGLDTALNIPHPLATCRLDCTHCLHFLNHANRMQSVGEFQQKHKGFLLQTVLFISLPQTLSRC